MFQAARGALAYRMVKIDDDLERVRMRLEDVELVTRALSCVSHLHSVMGGRHGPAQQRRYYDKHKLANLLAFCPDLPDDVLNSVPHPRAELCRAARGSYWFDGPDGRASRIYAAAI